MSRLLLTLFVNIIIPELTNLLKFLMGLNFPAILPFRELHVRAGSVGQLFFVASGLSWVCAARSIAFNDFFYMQRMFRLCALNGYHY